MNLLIISCPGQLSGNYKSALSQEINLVNQLFDAGLNVFHLRKPGSGIENCRRILQGIDAIYHDRIALHQSHELTNEFGIRRLHFSESERIDRKHTQPHLSFDKIISTSVHELAELVHLSGFIYTFFGPVFNSISKQDYRGTLTADFVLPKPINLAKIIALGGIDEQNISTVKAMGFDGAAILGAIWNRPAKALQTFKNCSAIC